MFQDTRFNNDFGMALYVAIQDFLNYYGILRERKKYKELNIKEINELNQKLKKFLKTNEANIQKLFDYYKTIKTKKAYKEDILKLKKH